MKTVIKLLINQSAPKETKPEYKQPSLEEKVKECCRRVKSNLIDSEKEWEFAKRVYEKLSRKPKLSKSEAIMLDELEELMIKYGKHDSDGVDMDAQFMNRGEKDDG